MTSLEGITLSQYVDAFEDVSRFRNLHYLGGVAAVATGLAIGIIGYCLLSNHLFGVNIGLTNNLIASIGGGTAITGFAIIGVLLHYAFNIDKHIDNSSKERFFEALTNPETQNDFSQDAKGWTSLRFKYMLQHQFSDENWIVMMQHIDKQVFHNPTFSFPPQAPIQEESGEKENPASNERSRERKLAEKEHRELSIRWIFVPFLLADLERFLRIYTFMKEPKGENQEEKKLTLLSPQCIKFLDPWIKEITSETINMEDISVSANSEDEVSPDESNNDN